MKKANFGGATDQDKEEYLNNFHKKLGKVVKPDVRDLATSGYDFMTDNLIMLDQYESSPHSNATKAVKKLFSEYEKARKGIGDDDDPSLYLRKWQKTELPKLQKNVAKAVCEDMGFETTGKNIENMYNLIFKR